MMLNFCKKVHLGEHVSLHHLTTPNQKRSKATTSTRFHNWRWRTMMIDPNTPCWRGQQRPATPASASRAATACCVDRTSPSPKWRECVCVRVGCQGRIEQIQHMKWNIPNVPLLSQLSCGSEQDSSKLPQACIRSSVFANVCCTYHLQNEFADTSFVDGANHLRGRWLWEEFHVWCLMWISSLVLVVLLNNLFAVSTLKKWETEHLLKQ